MQDKVGEYVFSKRPIDQMPMEGIFVAEIVGTFIQDRSCVIVRGNEGHLSNWYSHTDSQFNKVNDCTIIHKHYIVGPASSLFKELL